MRMRLRDSERSIFLDCSLLFFDAADIAPPGSAVQHTGQFVKPGYGANGVDLDAAIVEIAGIAGETKFHSGPLCEVAVADALDAPADEPSLSVDWFAGRFGHSDKS